MTPLDSTAPRPNTWLRTLLQHNPFYLLSAGLMLGGCLALTNSLSWSPIRLQRLLLLVSALQLYECLLIALGLFLLVRRRLRHDGGTLIAVAAFFMADVTFLSGEIANAHPGIGVVVNLILISVLLAKLALIYSCLSLPVAGRMFGVTFVIFAMLFSIAVLFKHLDSRWGRLPAWVLYAAWWVVAMLPIALTTIRLGRDRSPPANWGFAWLLVLVPLVSLIAHVSTSNFVLNVRWYNANLAPVFLGLAVALARADARVASLELRLRAQILLPIVAMILASTGGQPHSLVFDLGGVTFSQLRLTAMGSVLVLVHAFARFRLVAFAVLATLALTAGMLGANWDVIRHNSRLLLVLTVQWLDAMRPKTAAQWGVVAMVGAFCSLGVGAMISLRKPRAL